MLGTLFGKLERNVTKRFVRLKFLYYLCIENRLTMTNGYTSDKVFEILTTRGQYYKLLTDFLGENHWFYIKIYGIEYGPQQRFLEHVIVTGSIIHRYGWKHTLGEKIDPIYAPQVKYLCAIDQKEFADAYKRCDKKLRERHEEWLSQEHRFKGNLKFDDEPTLF